MRHWRFVGERSGGTSLLTLPWNKASVPVHVEVASPGERKALRQLLKLRGIQELPDPPVTPAQTYFVTVRQRDLNAALSLRDQMDVD